MDKRVTIIVTDSMGVGAAPDASKFGDAGADTLGHIIEHVPEIDIRNLEKLGIFKISGLERFDKNPKASALGAYGKMKEVSAGKDTTTGHWEIAGLKTQIPFKTYPDGFPKEFIEAFEKATGRKTVGNIPISGTEIIEMYGPHHEKTGDLIVYTSEDSVFQIAANVDVVPLSELYSACEKARELLKGEWACARVIARPYKIENGKRIRTSDRHDYSVSPPEKTMLDLISESGLRVHAIGKIRDIFNGCGVTTSVATKSNDDGVDKTVDALKERFSGLIFTNLVDFDSKYGHRRNIEGYAKAIEDFDRRLPEIMEAMNDEDILIICADHGNDPAYQGFNHTREFVPLLVYGKNVKPGVNLGIRDTFSDVAASVCDYLGVRDTGAGISFIKEIME